MLELNNETKFYLESVVEITKDEVRKIIQEEFEIDIDDFSDNDFAERRDENDNYQIIPCIDSYGGEGQGEEYWKISRVLNKNTIESFYIHFYGHYDSWNGVEWDGWRVVRPIQKTMIDFIGA